MTEAEWAGVEKQINAIKEQQALEELGQMLITQKDTILSLRKKVKEQALYIKMLDQVGMDRQEKLDKLEATLARLEKELLQLRCVNTKNRTNK